MIRKIVRSSGSRILLSTAAVCVLVPGCVALPTTEDLLHDRAPHLSPGAPEGIVDGRADFRRIFCGYLATDGEGQDVTVECDTWLHRLGDEPPAPAVSPEALPMPMQVLLVPGAFNECFGESARPFGASVPGLEASGHDVRTVAVGGRSGTAHNARQIAEYLDTWPREPDRPLVLVGYSKGTIDILQFLVDFPEQAAVVTAVVGVAGSVGGSPLADNADGLYSLLFSYLPSGNCPPGDGEVVHSLRTDVRREWLQDIQLPAHIKYYSLVAFTTRDRMARALIPSWEILLGHDIRNDGQLLPADAMIPNSILLGYLNADHWGVAMRIEDEMTFLAHRDDTSIFPHSALVKAVLATIAKDQAAMVSGADTRYSRVPSELP